MKQQTLAFFTLFIASFACSGNDLPKIISEECTTNDKIFNITKIKTALNSSELKREAVYLALGISSSSPNLTTEMFKGQWFYEYERDNVIFSGFNVRRHYLKTAIIINQRSITTILCDSANLKQSENSIHRKSPAWKEQLNSKIRIELGKISRKDTETLKKIYINQLNVFSKNGFVTDEEFRTIKNRIETK